MCRGPPLKLLTPLWWSESRLADCITTCIWGPPPLDDPRLSPLDSNPSSKPQKSKAILKSPLNSGVCVGCLCCLGYLCLPVPASPGTLSFSHRIDPFSIISMEPHIAQVRMLQTLLKVGAEALEEGLTAQGRAKG